MGKGSSFTARRESVLEMAECLGVAWGWRGRARGWFILLFCFGLLCVVDLIGKKTGELVEKEEKKLAGMMA